MTGTLADASQPKQLACRACHAANTVNHDLVIYKNTYTPAKVTYPSGVTNIAVNAAQVQQVEQHRIISNGLADIKVYNYGACLGCHTVEVFHAKPSWTHINGSADSYDSTDEPFDVLRYSPGRGKFNLFNSSWQHGLVVGGGEIHNTIGNEKSRAKNVLKNNRTKWANPIDSTKQSLTNAGTGYQSSLLFGQTISIPCKAAVNGALCVSPTTVIPYFNDIAAP